MLKHELAKLDIIDVVERHPGIKVHRFEASTSIGFPMRLTCTQPDYVELVGDLAAIGLTPDLRNVHKRVGTTEYEVFIEVTEDWRPVAEQAPKAG
jgi:hypothetical protein